jgi:hypothetical protein
VSKQNIQKYIKKIEENNNEMEVLTRNQHSLLEELDSVLVRGTHHAHACSPC